MKKRIITAFAVFLLILGNVSTKSFAATREVPYVSVWQTGWVDFGAYAPGTYSIVSSSLTDEQNLLLEVYHGLCNIPFARDFLACPVLWWGEDLLFFEPSAEFYIKLSDSNGAEIWSGTIKPGQDVLFLGEDHDIYNVSMKAVKGFYSAAIVR